jgi:ABC-type bacteriocin/lantibiotic exporter with double-glycine peptidase domain
MDSHSPQFQKTYGEFDYCGIRAVKQTQSNSCGIACLTSVLNYWGIEITEQDILTEFPKSAKEGYPILELKQIAENKGLQAYAISMQEHPIRQLKKEILKGRPVVCAVHFPRMLYFAYDVPIYGQVYRNLIWTFGPRKSHYIIVAGVDSTEFLIMDPVRGFVSIDQKDFESCWKEKSHAVLLCARKREWP